MKTKSYQELPMPRHRERFAPRSARFPRFMSMRAGAPRRLDRLRVSLIGCGAVGRVIAIHLARLGIGALWLADGKRYKPESLLTQAIVPADIGRPKALATARLCKQISPGTRVRYLVDKVQSAGWTDLAETDLVVLAADNLAAEVEVGQACFRLGTPLVIAAVHAESLVAQVKLFAHRIAEDPCVVCQLGFGERAALNAQVEYSCDGGAVEVSGQPTRSTSSLCSLAGDLALNQILRHVLKLGRAVSNELVQYCGYTNLTQVIPLVKRVACPEDHHILRRVQVSRPVGELTAADALGLARARRNASKASLVAGELEWVQAASCDCLTPRPVNRFVHPGAAVLGRCRQCRQPLRRGSFHSHVFVPAELLRPYARVPLRTLGAGSAPWLMVRVNGGGTWITTKQEAP